MKDTTLELSTPDNNFKNTIIKWGLISAAVSIIYSIINTQLLINEISFNKAINGLLSAVISITILFIGIKEYRDKFNGGYITFSKGFKTGFMIVLISTLIFAVFSYIYNSYIIDYSIIENNALKESLKYMKEKKLPEEQIKQSLEYTKKFLSINYAVISTVVGGIIIGSIFSLIVAAIVKKENKQYA